MNPACAIELATSATLLEKVCDLRKRGFRLVQIGATRLPDQVELTYTFDLNHGLINLRLHLPASQARVPSITGIYSCAVLYENEIHDLFNVRVEGMALDFQGNLYKTVVKFPFGSVTAPSAPSTPPTAGPAK